ncbi:histidine acid phosphatase [Dictyocaulus viviparus]|uniref:Histidine acid phosphatase n=1 Tax=Dictyocaulus viviparus TaxID=29172 RepID=A0A0D8XYF5_DICVI|nr:histidine acid phosphatase [Dictyocaulus viviparus]
MITNGRTLSRPTPQPEDEMNFLRILTVLNVLHDVFTQKRSTLQFVEFWFRHGERTPTRYMYFPSDVPLVPYSEAEAGELTNKGIQQAYQRGKFIRRNYDKFLGDTYHPSQIHVWAGDDNRTVISAEVVLAAVYEMDNEHSKLETLSWQPVATHNDPTIDWVAMGIEGLCTVYEKTFYESPEYQSILDAFNPTFIEFLENHTGVAIRSPIDFDHVTDALETKLMMNNFELPFPKWAEPIRLNITNIRSIFHQRIADAQRNTVGMYHSELFMSYIEDHISRPSRKKNRAVFISGHDVNLIAIGRQLNIAPLTTAIVPYAALLVVELHKINGSYFIEIWYASSLDDQLEQLTIPECGNPCSLGILRNILKDERLSRVDWELKCRGFGPQMGSDSIVIALILLIVTFFIATVMLLYRTLSYRKQLKDLKDPERRRLLLDNVDTLDNSYP